MKTILLALAISITAFSTLDAQSLGAWYDLDFDSQYGMDHLTIDTITNPNNIWQVGVPQKTVFNNAYNAPNVMVTDTLNDYPVNDTSVFYLTNVADRGFQEGEYVSIRGQFYVHSDTLTDYGKIEFSPDNGSTWIDLLNDTVGSWSWYDRPVLSGNSGGWKQFYINLTTLGYTLGVMEGDTILYKFSFISDSLQTNKDGLMYDDLHFIDIVETVEESGFDLISSNCFPNPTDNALTISFANDMLVPFEVLIYDITGKVIYSSHTSSVTAYIPVTGFSNGMYFYKLVNRNTREYSIGKFVKE